MKALLNKRKFTWILLVLAVTSQTMVSCGVRDAENTLQVQAMEQEKATESIPEESSIIEVKENDYLGDEPEISAIRERITGRILPLQ